VITGNRFYHPLTKQQMCFNNNPLYQWLLPSLKAMGYDSVYAEKTREAMGAEGQVDGCALCWRSDKLFLRESRVVSFNAKAMQLEERLPK
jgi:hypothetical protein